MPAAASRLISRMLELSLRRARERYPAEERAPSWGSRMLELARGFLCKVDVIGLEITCSIIDIRITRASAGSPDGRAIATRRDAPAAARPALAPRYAILQIATRRSGCRLRRRLPRGELTSIRRARRSIRCDDCALAIQMPSRDGILDLIGADLCQRA
jgi:hypothetical protein